MKKFLPAIIVIILLIIGGAGFVLLGHKASPPAENTNSAMKAAPTAAQSTSLFSSIQDALSRSLNLQCSFTDDQNRKVTAYIKAGAVRADSVGNDPKQAYNSSSVIIKDKKMYAWDTVKKQGVMMEVPSVTPPPSQSTTASQSGSSSQNPGDFFAALDKYRKYCKVAVSPDSLFAVPTDVTFQDLSKMMVPSVAAPTGMTQQQVQEMMKKYQEATPTTSGN